MQAQRKDSTLRLLRLLGILSIVLPLVLYVLLGILRFTESRIEAEQRVSRSLRVAHEHASKVISITEAIESRLQDRLQGHGTAELRRDEAALHLLLKEFVREQPQIQSIWIMGSDAKPIATSLFPAAPALDYSDRAYFQYHRDYGSGRFMSPPIVTRTTKERVLDLSQRFDDERGMFGGIINISLRTRYFEQFYGDLVADEPGLAVNLFHQRGEIYTRWPIIADAPDRLSDNSATMQAVKAGQAQAQVRGVSSLDGQDRLVAFRKIGDYPLYVGTGMNMSTQLHETGRELAFLLLLILPASAVMFFASQVALGRTRDAIESAERLERETLTRRRAEEALVQAQKLEALGRLTGGVAHDFNNALMVISNNMFLLRRAISEAGAADAGARQLDSIGRALDSATKLTRQLLAFSRRQALMPEYIRLQDSLPATRELIGPVMGSQISISVEVLPQTHGITADLAELELALLNLAINARDAMPSGGSFRLLARNVDGASPPPLGGPTVVIEARDTGSGIPPDVIDKVFEPFFTTKPVGHGTGLGLAQVYGLCVRAGGTATVVSEPQAGTVVSLFFPASEVAMPAATSALQRTNADLGKAVLLVEDNDDLAEVLVQLLEALDCRVSRVASAHAALEWLHGHQAALPDVVLTDVMMPGTMNGIGLARRLRETTPDLPVLLMTGYAEQLDAVTAEGFEVLPKPCTAEVLSGAIKRATGSAA
ncbi:MAG: hybrid sensor histidine kinase/response regulator [Comamonadaceae bacterium]|nr:MAG: hybrid sensor histidine kinase/response regulator [Comamonadaceae bacterium]